MTPHPFRPDHNGECLDCDESFDAHARPTFAHPDFWDVSVWRNDGNGVASRGSARRRDLARLQRARQRGRALASYRVAGEDMLPAFRLWTALYQRIDAQRGQRPARFIVTMTAGFVRP